MKTNTLAILPVIALILFATGCKREANINKASVDSGKNSTKLKAWIEQQGNSKSKMLNEIPLWENTRHIAERGINITPIKIGGIEIGEINTVYKFLVTNENSNGEIISGSYIYFIPNRSNTEGQDFKESSRQIASNSFVPDEIQDNFDGVILKYELNYKSIEAKSYKNGRIENKTASLLAKNDSKSTEVSSFAEVPCGVCIDWFLQTYDIETGQILSEIYLYTQCGNQNCEGGGGGGVPQSVYDGLMTFVNSIVVSNETKSILTLNENAEERTKKLEWKLVKGVGWHIYSWEHGVQVKTTNQTPGTQWKWQSIAHQGSAKVGVILGGTVSHSISYWNATLGLYNAIIDAQLSVTCSVLFRGSPVNYDLTYSCQKNFNVNEPYD